MKASIIAVCLFLAGSALAQSNAKLKPIRAANEAAESANAVAVGVHKREAAQPGANEGAVGKAAKPKPTPESK